MKYLIASSPTKEGIIAMINKFYYSKTFAVNFDNGEVSNKNGLVQGVQVTFKNKRYRFESI